MTRRSDRRRPAPTRPEWRPARPTPGREPAAHEPDTASLGDGELLAAVRRGDVDAYAELYARHAGPTRRLARRLCRDPYEADDVVSDVFANTLRAIQHGGGPHDEFGAYALRAVRNTVAKLRTRTDSARAVPAEVELLDRPVDDARIRVAGDVERALAELPERFRHVLWTTAVEGHTPAELAAAGAAGTEGLDAGAVATLSQRARKALGRSYLRVRTNRPTRHADCRRVRNSLPGYVQQTAAAGTARQIEAHLAGCVECALVRDEMRELNRRLRTVPWLALFAAAARRAVLGVAGAGAPAAVTAAAAPAVVLAVAGTMIVRHTADREPADSERAAAAAYATAHMLPAAPARTGDPGTPSDPAEPSGATPTAGPPPMPTTVPPGPTPPDPTPPGPTPLGAPATTPPDEPAATPPAGPRDGPDTADPGAPGARPDPPTGAAGGPELPGSPGSGVAGTVTGALGGGVADAVVPAATDGLTTLVGDVDATVGGIGNVVGALPNGVPAVVAATGELVGTVETTLGNTLATTGNVVAGVATTVDATAGAAVATVDHALTGAVGDVGALATIDPADPVGDLLGDVAGEGGLLGPGGTVGQLLGGLGLAGPGASAPCPLLCGAP